MTLFRMHLALAILVMTTLACQAQGPASVMTLTPPAKGRQARAVMTTLPTTARVIAIRSLNVRQSPGHDNEENPVIGALYHGDPVVMTGKCHAGWAEIRWESGTAFVNARYLSGDHC